jgi:CsoR family transcriptional regulator, copper-sensing transcriptional repressor
MEPDIKKRLQHRLSILEGQIRGLKKMVDDEEYCMDIITQSLAAQKALGSVNKLVAENHIKTHIAHMMASGDLAQITAAQEELSKIYELNNRGDQG